MPADCARQSASPSWSGIASTSPSMPCGSTASILARSRRHDTRSAASTVRPGLSSLRRRSRHPPRSRAPAPTIAPGSTRARSPTRTRSASTASMIAGVGAHVHALVQHRALDTRVRADPAVAPEHALRARRGRRRAGSSRRRASPSRRAAAGSRRRGPRAGPRWPRGSAPGSRCRSSSRAEAEP